MAWLLSALRPVIEWIAKYLLLKLMKDLFDKYRARKLREAKLKEAANIYKKAVDPKEQEDALNKLIDAANS